VVNLSVPLAKGRTLFLNGPDFIDQLVDVLHNFNFLDGVAVVECFLNQGQFGFGFLQFGLKTE
jgi:hypothetical protein